MESFQPRYLNRLSVTPFAPEDPITRNLESPAFEMSSYLIKPREPTVLSHKEYHELSPTNLMVSAVVRLPLNDLLTTKLG